MIVVRIFYQLVDHSIRIAADGVTERTLLANSLTDDKGIIPNAEAHVRAFVPHIQIPGGKITAKRRIVFYILKRIFECG